MSRYNGMCEWKVDTEGSADSIVVGISQMPQNIPKSNSNHKNQKYIQPCHNKKSMKYNFDGD